MHNPIEHFELHAIIPLHLFGFDISINKAVIMMWVCTILILLFFRAGMKKRSLVPGRLQSVVELLVDFLYGMVAENIGEKDAKKYFPYIASLFMFILFCNLTGLVPGTHTVTSQIIVTGFFAVLGFAIAMITGFVKHGTHFFSIFCPPGVPLPLVPIMIPIEIISLLAKPFSLSVRLFANMTAGHTVLLVLFGLVVTVPALAAWIPFVFSVLINALEVFIGVVQAYIFTILTCVYIGDANKMAH
ncbi:MAG: F0F1 ATP synthase subunit A [Nitrospinae bacterium]|nr:F0F1 ATP synthase subunit A [Nitrospinota bacterium]